MVVNQRVLMTKQYAKQQQNYNKEVCGRPDFSGTKKKIVALRLSRTGFHTHKGSSKTEKEKAGQNNKRVVLQDFRLMIEFPDSSCVNILMRL